MKKRNFFKILAGITSLAFVPAFSVFAKLKKEHRLHPLREFRFDGGWQIVSTDRKWEYATLYSYGPCGDYNKSKWIYFSHDVEKNTWYYQGSSEGTGRVLVAEVKCSFFKMENTTIYYSY